MLGVDAIVSQTVAAIKTAVSPTLAREGFFSPASNERRSGSRSFKAQIPAIPARISALLPIMADRAVHGRTSDLVAQHAPPQGSMFM